MPSFLLFSLLIHLVSAHKPQCFFGRVVMEGHQKVWSCYPLQLIVAACLCMLVGIYFMSVGFPLFIVSMAMVGLVFGSSLTWVSLKAAEPTQGYPMSLTFYLCVCLGVGLLFAVATLLFWRIGMFMLCGVAGYCFSFFIWSWRENFMIEQVLLRHLASLSVALFFTLTVMIVEFAAVIISMSFLGAWLFIFGLDLFLQTGFSNSILQLLIKARKEPRYVIDLKVYGMLSGVLGLWFVACVWQRFFNRGKRFGLRVIENTNNTLKV
ncbi:hypothetical protein G6F56_009816 [Rhizopus delemar]|nr:hypothetical protein G6F56_009816 [Rhizopus delemar]